MTILKLEDFSLLPLPKVMADACLRASYINLVSALEVCDIHPHECGLSDMFRQGWTAAGMAREPDAYAREQWMMAPTDKHSVLPFVLVRRDGHVPAETILCLNPHPDGPRADSTTLVDPGQKQCGIGSIILAHLVGIAGGQGCRTFHATVAEANVNSHRRFDRLVEAGLARREGLRSVGPKWRHYTVPTYYRPAEIHRALLPQARP